MQTQTLVVGPQRSQVEFLEAGAGPPVVFLPGIWGQQWNDFLDGLAQDHRVIAPHLPGTGGSTGDDDIIDIQGLVYHLADLFDALDLRDVTLIGHGLGGMVAAELASMEPARYRRLVLIAPFGLWNDAHANVDTFVYRDRPEDLKRLVFKAGDHPAADELFRLPGEDGVAAMTVERARLYQVAAKYMWPIPERGLARRIHRIAAPTLIVWGQHDGLVPPDYAQDFAGAINGSKVVLLEDSGHAPHIEQPGDVLAAIRDHIG